MVNGRFGQRAIFSESEITPETIINEPEIPARRFGFSVERAKAQQQRAIGVRGFRQEVINEAQKLENEFFSQKITIQESEQAFVQVDPFVKQFIKTTPEVRRQRAIQTTNEVKRLIIEAQQKAQELRQRQISLSGEQAADLDYNILERETFASGLQQVLSNAEQGAFNLNDLIGFAGQKASGEVERLRNIRSVKTESEERLISGGLTRAEARQVITEEKISSVLAQKLTPQLRRSLGIEEERQKAISPNLQQIEKQKIGVKTGTIETGILRMQEAVIKKVQLVSVPEMKKQNLLEFIKEKKLGILKFSLKEVLERKEKPDLLEEKFSGLLTRAEEIRKEKTLKSRGERVVLGFATTIGETLFFGKSLIKEPSATISAVGISIKEFVKSPIIKTKGFVEKQILLAKTDPFFFAGKVAGELILLKGTSKVISLTGEGTQALRTRISSKFVPYEKIPTKTAIAGKIKDIPTSKGILDIPIAKPIKKILEPLSEQVKLAGTKQTIVSAQTGFFGTIIKRQKKLTRPLFFDPKGRLRISRLDIEAKELSLMDIPKIIKGEIKLSFKKERLQALILPKELIQKFPTGLKDIKKTIISGRFLKPSQQKRFTKFLETPTGFIKPLGKLTKEPEVILSIGETITRGKLKAVTLIKGRRIEIFEPVIQRTGIETTKRIITKEALQKQIESLSISSREIPTSSIGASSQAFFISSIFKPIKFPSMTTSISNISSQKLPLRFPISPPISPPKKPSKPFPPISPFRPSSPINPPTTPPISPPISPPIIPPTIISPPIIPPIRPPRIPPIRPPMRPPRIPNQFLFNLKPKKRRRTGKDDIALVESFTARILKFKPLGIPQTQLRMVIPKFQTIGERYKPIVIPASIGRIR